MTTFKFSPKEPSLKAYSARILLALAQIIDGIIGLLTLGFVNSTFGLKAAWILVAVRNSSK